MLKVESAIVGNQIHFIEIDELHEFQGELKDLSVENYEKFKSQIIRLKYSFVKHVWKNDGKWWIIDGHQTKRVLITMRNEGYTVPPIACVEIAAENYEEAKDKVLSGASQFGEMTGQGLYEFISEAGLDPNDVMTNYRFPELDLDSFHKNYFDTKQVMFDAKVGSKEINANDFNQFNHTCPKCGFGFDE